MQTKTREFVYEPKDFHDKEIVEAYIELMMEYDFELFSIEDEEELAEVEEQLLDIIKQEPNYLEPYMNLLGIYDQRGDQKKYDKYLEQAYKGALNLILDKQDNWPEVMEWGWLENRSIIRALQNTAMKRWKEGKTEEAKQILQNLLKVNPRDNSGVRYSLLGILEGMSFEEFELKMGDTGFVPDSIPKWFDKNVKSHKEFDEWKKKWDAFE